MIDLVTVSARDSRARKLLTNFQSKGQETIDVFEFELLAVVVHQKKPVSTPGYISSNWSNTRDVDRDLGGETITRHVRHFHFSILIELRDHDSNGRFDAMIPRTDAVQVGQRRDHADRAVSAHPQKARAIEKDDASHT